MFWIVLSVYIPLLQSFHAFVESDSDDDEAEEEIKSSIRRIASDICDEEDEENLSLFELSRKMKKEHREEKRRNYKKLLEGN